MEKRALRARAYDEQLTELAETDVTPTLLQHDEARAALHVNFW
jgi:hypothetical protein